MKISKFGSGALLFSNLCFFASSSVVQAEDNGNCSETGKSESKVSECCICFFWCNFFEYIASFFCDSSNDGEEKLNFAKDSNAIIENGDSTPTIEVNNPKDNEKVPLLSSEKVILSEDSSTETVPNGEVHDESGICNSEESILRRVNIVDLAKDKKYKKGILKAIYACLFLWKSHLQENCAVNLNFVHGLKERERFFKFLKDLEKNDLLVRDRLYKGEIGVEFFDYIESIRFITKSGKRLIARFMFDNIDSLGGWSKCAVYNMYWNRSAGKEDVYFDDFVKDLNFSSEQVVTVTN